MDVSSIPEPKSMGYAFDDGPNCTHNAFYNYLSSQNQKATMFYIGSNVLDWPLEAQRALADGHEICARQCSPLVPSLACILGVLTYFVM
jgi:Polysaccharide deacetylase